MERVYMHSIVMCQDRRPPGRRLPQDWASEARQCFRYRCSQRTASICVARVGVAHAPGPSLAALQAVRTSYDNKRISLLPARSQASSCTHASPVAGQMKPLPCVTKLAHAGAAGPVTLYHVHLVPCKQGRRRLACWACARRQQRGYI